jgi:hypothetical protein
VTSPAPGWYPDPGGAAPLRWWNGQAWTTATSDGAAPVAPQQQQTTAPPPTPVTFAPAQPAAATEPAAPTSDEQPGMTVYGTPSPFGSTSTSSHRANDRPPRADTVWNQNQYAVWTFGIAAIYLIVVLVTGAGVLGILPAFTAYQSQQHGEPLAPVAVGIAAIGVIVGVLSLTNAL